MDGQRRRGVNVGRERKRPRVKTKRQLQSWVTRGVDYAKSLPPK